MKKIIAIFLLLIVNYTYAQDIHYSQYNVQVLLLNPAISGMNECDYRVGAIHRTQWYSVSEGNTYRTSSVFADMAVYKPRKGSNYLGAGISFFSDQAGDLNYNTNKVDISLAYHVILNKNTKQSFSLGLKGGFAQRTVDRTKAIFSYDPITGKPSLTNSEPLRVEPLLYGDVGFGFLWSTAPKRNNSYHLGFALDHLNQPNLSGLYTRNDNEKKSIKFTGHFGSSIPISDRIAIMPGFMLLKQGASFEANISNYFKYSVSDNPNSRTAFYIGTMYRVNDAFIAAVRADVNGFSINLSYDINVSKLSVSTKSQGGPEIGISYTGCIKRVANQSYCPDF